MNVLLRNLQFALIPALLLSAACDGAGEGSLVEESDADTNSDGNSDAEPEIPTSILCPEPGTLPFTTESTAFADPANTTLYSTNPIYAFQNIDVVVGAGDPQIVRGRFARGTNVLLPKPVTNEAVSLWTFKNDAWTQLARTTTDADGFYEFSGFEQFEAGTYVTYAILEGAQACAEHGIFAWPEGTEFIISDIDGTMTLSDEELLRQLTEPAYDPVENGSANELMEVWYQKNYRLIFLTARPHTFRTQTRTWLREHGFPFTPVISADSLVFDESARTYKREFVNRITGELGWTAIAAYGNAESDIQAYEDAGIPKDITFIIGEFAGAQGTTPIQNNDYASHISEYVEPFPRSTQWEE